MFPLLLLLLAGGALWLAASRPKVPEPITPVEGPQQPVPLPPELPAEPLPGVAASIELLSASAAPLEDGFVRYTGAARVVNTSPIATELTVVLNGDVFGPDGTRLATVLETRKVFLSPGEDATVVVSDDVKVPPDSVAEVWMSVNVPIPVDSASILEPIAETEKAQVVLP